MKKTSLYYFLTLICLMAGIMVSCSDNDTPNDESVLKFEDLPLDAQKFITKYFYDAEIKTIEQIEQDDLTLYEVALGDYNITFNESGEWQQIAASYGMAIPESVIPEQVLATLNERYPGFGVNMINKSGQNFIVVLTDNQGENSIRLTFNQSGEIIDTSMN